MSVVIGDAQVLTALDKEERHLFHDRLRYLDKRITPGVSKLAWTSPKATLDFFYKEACMYGQHVLQPPAACQWSPGQLTKHMLHVNAWHSLVVRSQLLCCSGFVKHVDDTKSMWRVHK